MSEVRGVILDIDGTLIDSNDAHARAWVAALAEHGARVDRAQVRDLIGMGGDKLLPALCDYDPESREAEAVSERRTEIFRERFLPVLQPFPEVRALLQHMKKRGLSLSVASSAKREELSPLLALTGASDLIEAIASSDDAARSKPDPDIVQEAVKRIGIDARHLVMLGDTPYDVEAARAAGVRIIAFRCGGWNDDALRGAAAIYDGPSDMLRRYPEWM